MRLYSVISIGNASYPAIIQIRSKLVSNAKRVSSRSHSISLKIKSAVQETELMVVISRRNYSTYKLWNMLSHLAKGPSQEHSTVPMMNQTDATCIGSYLLVTRQCDSLGAFRPAITIIYFIKKLIRPVLFPCSHMIETVGPQAFSFPRSVTAQKL
jgi:hypothetical protein